MKKIPTLFQRNYDTDRLVHDEVTPGCEWVLAGEGIPTEKLDGTCCMVRDGILYKRLELKAGKTAPRDFIPAQEADLVTGSITGWVRVTDGPEDKWHREAFEYWKTLHASIWPDGTYELIGPKIQGNPYNHQMHALVPHNATSLIITDLTYQGAVPGISLDFDLLKGYLDAHRIEGIVWHHPDGERFAKLKRRDFGFPWPVQTDLLPLPRDGR